MNTTPLISQVCYSEEYKELSNNCIRDDFHNIIFNIATKECSLFPKFVIFRAINWTKQFVGYNYWFYTGTYSNNWGTYLVLLNIIISDNVKQIRCNNMFSVDLKDVTFSDGMLKFNKFTDSIGGFGRMVRKKLEFEKTDLTFDIFTDENNFVTYRIV